MKKKFAVFDIDGTVIRDALFFQTIDELTASGHLSPALRAKLDEKLEAHRQRRHRDSYSDYALTGVELLFKEIRGVAIKDYRLAVDKVIRRTKSYTYVYTRELIKKLKQQGYFLIALSGSEMYAVKQFTSHHGFDVAVGEIYEEKAGKFTGKIEGVVHHKDTFLKQLVTKYDLTYEDSYGIGDGRGDARMLELVEHPIAFNPEYSLFEEARQKGWKIVVERKNVIYELEASHGPYVLA